MKTMTENESLLAATNPSHLHLQQSLYKKYRSSYRGAIKSNQDPSINQGATRYPALNIVVLGGFRVTGSSLTEHSSSSLNKYNGCLLERFDGTTVASWNGSLEIFLTTTGKECSIKCI